MSNINRTTSKTFESNSGNLIRVVVSDRDIFVYKKDPETLRTEKNISERDSNLNYGYRIYFDSNDNLFMDSLFADVSKSPVELKTNTPGHFYIFNSINKISAEVDYYVKLYFKKIAKTIYPDVDLSQIPEDLFLLELAKMSSPFLRSLPCNIDAQGSKNFFSVKNRGLGYKEIIKKYTGVDSKKMLKSIWSILIYRKTRDGAQEINESIIRFFGAFCKNAGPDYTYQFIEKFAQLDTNFGFYCPYYITEKTIKPLFKIAAPKKIVNILSKDVYDTSTYLSDVLGMLNQYETKESIPPTLREEYPEGLTIEDNFSSLKELHDKIMVKYNSIKIEENKKPILCNPIYLKLNEQKKSEFSFFVPENTSELIRWGIKLNICIGSYCEKAVNGDTLLLGILKNKKIAYCLEFMVDKNKQFWTEGTEIDLSNCNNKPLPVFKTVEDSWNNNAEGWSYTYPTKTVLMPEIVQLKGERNCSATDEDKAVILEMIKAWSVENRERFIEADVSVSDGYIGI